MPRYDIHLKRAAGIVDLFKHACGEQNPWGASALAVRILSLRVGAGVHPLKQVKQSNEGPCIEDAVRRQAIIVTIHTLNQARRHPVTEKLQEVSSLELTLLIRVEPVLNLSLADVEDLRGVFSVSATSLIRLEDRVTFKLG